AEDIEQLAQRQVVLGQRGDDRGELLAERGTVVLVGLVPCVHAALHDCCGRRRACRRPDIQSTRPESSGTNTTGARLAWLITPSASLRRHISDCAPLPPTGATSVPPGASCVASASTSAGAA